LYNPTNNCVAWEKLKLEMNKAGLGPGEQEMIKKEILHREAIINREGYICASFL
jgi:hypothetical protein